ncbi:MAG: tetratricopeptide repeat protein [Actinomycetota bacterium]|nr:tetratricopeptide repeat protein [Actinomycetota bacterium]
MFVRISLIGLALLFAPPAVAVALEADSSPMPSGCSAGDAALDQAKLGKAQKAYLDALESEPGLSCAVAGLNEVTRATRAEERLCAEGKALADKKLSEESRQSYVGALRLNVDSECAAKGLTPPADDKKEFEEWVDLIPKALLALGALLLAGLLALAAIYLLWITVNHVLRPSLRIKPFLDDGVEPKVGAATASMVETRLHELSGHKGDPETGYQLDLVVADVELFAADQDLASAVGAFADVPQLKVLVALLASLDRLVGRRSFIASGDLAPAGKEGDGLALAVHRRNRLHARRTLWAKAPSSPRGEGEQPNPAGFYELVVPAASWVQYEVAAGLDSDVRLLTTSPESWSRLGSALALQRQGEVLAAVKAYLEALALDPDNVGALVNLSVLISREFGLYRGAIMLLLHARNVLIQRYGDWE